MRRCSLILSFLLILVFNLAALAQSGRGRPVTPKRESAPAVAPPPAPVMVPEATSISKREQAGNLSRFMLKNGITVIIHERHAYPLAAVVAYFKTPESAATRSAATLLPKVMLRGTLFRNGEQISNEMRALGCLMSAEARPGSISFSFLTPPDKLKDGLAIQADVIQHPTFADEEIKRQAALLPSLPTADYPKSSAAHFDLDTDKLMQQDDAAVYSLSRLLAMAFNQPSGEATAINRDQLMQFYQANLRPDNLVFVVVGDVIPFTALVEIQRLYGAFKHKVAPPENPASGGNKPSNPTTAANRPQPSAAKPSTKTPVNAAQKNTSPTPTAKPAPTTAPTESITAAPPAEKPALKYANERSDLTQTVVSVGFRLPKLDSKEQATLAVLSRLLAEGRGSRLWRNLFIGQGVLSRVEPQFLPSAGLLAVQMWLDPAMIDRAEAAFFREVNRLRREIPTEAEIVRARMLAEKQFVEANRDDLQRAFWLAEVNDLQQPLRVLNEARQRLQEVGGEDLQRAAATYLMLANTIVHEHEPLSVAPRTFDASQFAATVTNWAAGFGEAIDAKQLRPAEESFALVTSSATGKSEPELRNLESIEPLAVKNFSTLNGPQAYVREDRSQPCVTIAILFPGGRVIEEETNQGLTGLMLRTMLYGTAKRPQAAEELEQLGATVEVITEADFYGFQITTLSRNAAQTLRIARDLIEEPAFRDEDIVKARAEQVSLIRSRRDALLSRANELMMQGLFANHPYGFPVHGREGVLSKLSGESVKEWHSRTVKRMLPALIIVGDTDGSALIAGEVANNFRRPELDKSLRARVPPAIKPVEKVEPRKTAIAALEVGFVGAKGGTDDSATLDLLEAALNGATGKLMTEVREKQHLAHQIFITNRTMLLGSVIGVQVLTASENEQRAASALAAEFDRLTKTGLSADEFKNAKAVASIIHLLRGRTPEHRALAYARAVFLQKPATDVDAQGERLANVTAEDVKRAAAAYFKSSSASVGIVRGATAQK